VLVIAFANLLYAIGMMLDMLLTMMMILVIARAVVSWVNADPYNPIVRFLISSTDVFLMPLRRKFNLVYGAMDFSPIVLILAIYFLKFFVAQTLLDYSQTIKLNALRSEIVSISSVV
jgi:YggT family protein